MKNYKSRHSTAKAEGFTLIELLVVVCVVAILAVIAIPQYTLTVEKAKATELVKLTRDIYNSMERYSFRNNISILAKSVTDFNNLDIELEGTYSGTSENPRSTLTNDYSTITLIGNAVEATRTLSENEYYKIIINKNTGKMTCQATKDTDADKVCLGLGNGTTPTISGSTKIYAM
ncbi:prepilin-type N-terminal cleavage/methylation domain-containing protein [Elusimicrobium simillimum]|uniref:type IV pilin protein n=1 Tax=Elusimicrobium simillimum TaxID=3143438 RepID=UPI003C6F135A